MILNAKMEKLKLINMQVIYVKGPVPLTCPLDMLMSSSAAPVRQTGGTAGWAAHPPRTDPRIIKPIILHQTFVHFA
ncbi:hypothetical protein DCMF_12110 [Candidatus Formimonas warabiya]|uniref:Uncharacterized protein n=1 Tax=Formimonas warabiya TaxID=1761012 RepID=A0A3G1KSL3_FORW1|nr:hypothetical protein DCMF_12110 [Candidatus Formimonas warabiya]